jgi:hypothetical protein
MKRQRIKIALLPCLLVLLLLVTAGTWSANDFFYRPSLGARGAEEKTYFDSGMERVDAHLGKYKTLGDPHHATLSEALDTIGTETEVTLTIPAGTVPVTSNTTIPPNIALRILKGGKFNINNTITLIINGPIEAGPYQIFSWTGTGAVSFGSNSKVSQVYPEWWGAAGDGTTDDTDEVKVAYDAVKGKKIWLTFNPNRTYAMGTFAIIDDDTWIRAYGSKLLHNGNNEPLVSIDHGNPGSGALHNVRWFGGTLIAKPSSTDPTTDVLYFRQVWNSQFRDIEIFCGDEGDRWVWASQTPYANYGLRTYCDNGDGLVQFNTFENIRIFGAKEAGIKFDTGTPGEICLDLQESDLSALTVGQYVRGVTSGSTARITHVDDVNNRLYLDRWYGPPTHCVFATGETIKETSQRDDEGAGTWDSQENFTNSATKAYSINYSGPADNQFLDCQVKGCNIGLYMYTGRFNYFSGGWIHSNNTYNILQESECRGYFFGVKVEGAATADYKAHYGYWNQGKTVFLASVGTLPSDTDTSRMMRQFGSLEYNRIGGKLEFYSPQPQISSFCPSSGTEVLRGKVDGDTGWRFNMRGAGDWRWGSGSGDFDVQLSRSSADVLQLASGDTFKLDRVRFTPLSSAPSPTTDGDVAYADGVGWNPGGGAGLYVRTGSAWVKLH